MIWESFHEIYTVYILHIFLIMFSTSLDLFNFFRSSLSGYLQLFYTTPVLFNHPRQVWGRRFMLNDLTYLKGLISHSYKAILWIDNLCAHSIHSYLPPFCLKLILSPYKSYLFQLPASSSRDLVWTQKPRPLRGVLNVTSIWVFQKVTAWRSWYCWWLKSCTSWYVVFPIIYRVSAPSQVVVWDFSHQQ